MKIKVRLSLIFLLFIGSQLSAQTYGNEWIVYNQKYYQFKVVQTGIYRIDHSLLLSAGIPLNMFTSGNMQLFGREKEIPLYIVDGNDNSFDSGDYILFYAEKNDGWLDSTLYPNPDKLGNPAYSLYNDTLNYFFTWNSSNNNLRFVEETDINFSAFSPTSFINWNHTEEFHNAYFEGESAVDLSSSFFNDIESFSSGSVVGPSTYNFNIPTGTIFTGFGAPMANLQINAFGSNNPVNTAGGAFNHHLQYTIGASDSIIFDTLFQGIRGIQFKTSLNPASLANGTTVVRWKNVGSLPVAADRQGISYLSLTFPRLPVLNGFPAKKFTVSNQFGQSKIHLNLTWTAANPLLFSFGDVPRKLTAVSNSGSSVQALLPNNPSGTAQTIVYTDVSTIQTVNNLTAVNGTGNFRDFSLVPTDSALLMIYEKRLELGANEYRNYRTSLAGGGHQVILADVDELYLQFGGGIPKHINGVRRFAHYLYNLSVKKPAALFLVGKGIREASVLSSIAGGAGTRENIGIYAQSMIPSFGQPSSDIAITASLLPNNLAPLIPTGRISVTTNAELLRYLEKIIEYESQIDSTSIYNTATKDWQKHILHFAGGLTAIEQFNFRSFLESMQNTIETDKFGGKVKRIYKQNSDPLDPSTFNEIAERLRAGVSLINFFGHANAGTVGFEINIDEPSNWNNKGKYPIVIANTCYNGNIFNNENTGFSTSEKFVRAANSGAIAYLSTVSLGFAGPLNIYSQGLYNQFSKQGYGHTLGKQIQDNINLLANSGNFNGIINQATLLQMSLNGDPMVKLNYHVKPEIELRDESVSFGPTKIDLTVDSIVVNIELKNLGQSITDTFLVQVVRNFPQSGNDSIYRILVPELHYTSSIQVKMPLQPNIGIGLNQFTISADIPSFYKEVYDELNNNQIIKNLFINIEGIQPVAPHKFAVVPKDSVVLKASTIDPLASVQTYIFEIDTTDLFNSPFKRTQSISQLGGVKEAFPAFWLLSSSNQSAPLVCTDSTVYFWRVALLQSNLEWRESSFQYIPTKIGWGQDHFFQFKENGFSQIDYDRPTRKLNFSVADTNFLDCFVQGFNTQTFQNYWTVNGSTSNGESDLCFLTPSLHVGVVDPFTFEAWGTRWINSSGDTTNPTRGFGNVNDISQCRNRVEKYFIFRQNSASQLAAFQNMVLNEVPNGHYIIIYAPRSGAQYSQWNALDSVGMYATFATLGSDSINGNRPDFPMAFFVQKGNPSSAIELFGQSQNDPVHLTAPMIGFDYLGQETSTLIGPVAKWNSFYWKIDPEEALVGDTTYFSLDRYDGNQTFQSSITIPIAATDSILTLQNFINATSSPYMKLNALFFDSLNLTPGQLDRWHVLYDPVPEAAIDGTNGYYWTAGNEPLNEGETISFAIDIRNISDRPMDSLLVHYYVTDENNVKHLLNYPRQDSLRVNQTLRDTFTFSTSNFTGSNIFWMEVNPYSGPFGSLDQPEQFHFNNLLQIPFLVNRDEKNPILDVTFDGRHILNGDIVNPMSEIRITLKDDNPLLLMDNISDTALFGIYLTDPSGVQRRIPFEANGQTVMQWIPADAQSKRFKIMYPGEFGVDGKYTLLVQGSDKSGNLSGDLAYRITFEIIRESTITKLMNYPNPFSTSTRFVFTLTGSEVPDDLIIQIMTVTGKIVREITESEFGPIYIGRNISEFAWNGTDEFGDQLANGVYLYRVKMKLNGENIKQRDSGADQYFTKDFGKMYLFR